MEREAPKTPPTKKRGIYVEDELWYALQGSLRGDGTNVSDWFRRAARQYLADKQLESQGTTQSRE